MQHLDAIEFKLLLLLFLIKSQEIKEAIYSNKNMRFCEQFKDVSQFSQLYLILKCNYFTYLKVILSRIFFSIENKSS